MKIVLSRKGFDAKAGGRPSPIFPDGTMTSLPIPARETLGYGDVTDRDGEPLARLMAKLGVKENVVERKCHLDPDLYPWALPRKAGWRPLFGQQGGAQTHLDNYRVGVGDLFLFFGWFRAMERFGDGWRYARGARDLHVIFGYFEVGEVWRVEEPGQVPDYASYHPHAGERHLASPNNTLYAAAASSSLVPGLPGAGTLLATPSTILTKDGYPRTRWNLDPTVFRDLSISHHSPDSWNDDYFQSAAIGQEFVVQESEKVRQWAARLIAGSKEDVTGRQKRSA